MNKILDILEKIGAFIVKHWRWMLPILCVIIYLIFPGGFLAGMAAIGFLWSSYAAWKNWETEKRLERLGKELMEKIKKDTNT